MRIRTGVRLICLSVVAGLLFLALAGRLYAVQVIKGADYARRAHDQRTLSLPVAQSRGLILDRNGIPLTAPERYWGVALFPSLIRGAQAVDRVSKALAPAGSSALELAARISTATDPFWLPQPLETALAQELPGVAVGPRERRYGQDAVARHLVGYINTDGGQMGLERALDAELAGDATPELVAYRTGSGGPLFSSAIRTMLPTKGKPPYSVKTTIDLRVQKAVEEVLDQDRRTAAGKAAVVVMDPQSGEVLAMASRPVWDYQSLEAQGPAPLGEAMVNRAVTAMPPGSVMKPLVAAEALERGLITMDGTFNCSGQVEIGGVRFSDFGGKSHGQITLRDAIAESCNVSFLQLGAERLGVQRLQEAARRFGFGAAAGLLGPGRTLDEEQAGYVPSTAQGGGLQIAFGQVIEASPLQMARAYAALANGGVLPPVKLIQEIQEPDGTVVSRPPAGESQRVISQTTARQIQQALLDVTGHGTGVEAARGLPGGAAGKTGTAEDGGTSDWAWFAGYLPVTSPRYVVVVTVEGGTGGSSAAPVFREIARMLQAIRVN